MRHIRQGDSAFVVKSTMPSKWWQPTGVNITITRDNGTALVASTAASLYAGDTTSAAIAVFSKTCVLTTGNALESESIVSVGSDAYGYREMVVDSYNATTQTVTFKDRFTEALPAGVSVVGREMSYTLDASGSDFDFVGNVSVVWTPTGISELPFTELFTVLKRESASGGLATKFEAQFEDYWHHCENNFSFFEQTARRQIAQHLKNMNRNFAKIIDSDEYDYAVMLRIALNIAATHGEGYEVRYTMLKEQYETELSILIDNEQWDDTDQDLIAEEGEVNSGSTIGYARGH